MHTALIIEQDANLRRLLTEVVRAAGCNVLQAADGNEGMGVFLRVRPRFVFVDVLAPVTDGLEIIRAIRASTPDTVITAMLGNSFFGDLAMLQVARMLGANHTTTKFPPYTDAIETVNSVLYRPELPMVEQRMYYRFDRRINALVHWHQTCDAPVACDVLNLSLGGAMLRTRACGHDAATIDTGRFDLLFQKEDGLDGLFTCVRTRLEQHGDDLIIGACFPSLAGNGKKVLNK